MTTNIERAAELILRNNARRYPFSGPAGTAQALADAGLITPDLPEPTRMITPAWTEFSDYIDVRDNSVCVYMADNYGDDPLRFTPTEARQHAAALLAAANHAEQEQGNGD